MLRGLVGAVYDKTLRPYLPRRIVAYNGVPAPSKYKLLDFGYTPAQPNYEGPLCEGIRRTVREKEQVNIIGGGKGVSAVIAAECTFPTGEVNIYEASIEQCKYIKRTCNYNPSGDRITIHHAAVGDMSNAYGDIGSPEILPPSDLPDSDILIIDAEGAEADILPKLEASPRAIIVESHGCFNSPTKVVQQDLERKGYDVSLIGYESPEEDVAVLQAVNQ